MEFWLVQPNPMLMIPGPTPVPEAVLEVLARPPIGHRSPEFKAVLQSVYAALPPLFGTKRPVYVYTASGTGAMEAALVNTVPAGGAILVLSCGVFSQRWAEIANTLGLTVHVQTVPAGHAHDLTQLEAFLKGPDARNVQAVCCIHNETSTGVMNPVAEIARIVRAYSDALVIVDTVTSLGAVAFEMDAWGVDVAVSGSQKGFMLPPGLAFLACSERALARHQQVSAPGYYFNFTHAEKNTAAGQTPWTPALGLIRGLEKALELMHAEGVQAIEARHRLNQQMIRQAATAMGLSLFVPDEQIASPAITAILPPEGISVDDIRAGIKRDFAITLANGQKDLTGKIFRVGHLGAIFPRDMLTVVSALEATLARLGYTGCQAGAGSAAAQQVWRQAHG
jgi:aspartate aminotransferase-like enzyme